MAAVAASAVANNLFLMEASLFPSLTARIIRARCLPEWKLGSNGFCSWGTSVVALDKSQRDVHRAFIRKGRPLRSANHFVAALGVSSAVQVSECGQLLGKQAPLETTVDFHPIIVREQ
jgi:hypothetical protein